MLKCCFSDDMFLKLLELKKNPFVINSIVTLFLRVLGVLTLFGFTFFLTHNYEAKVVGEYETIRVFLLVIGSVVLLGMEQSVFYFSGKYQAFNQNEKIKKVYFKMVQLLLLTTLAAILIYLAIPRELILEYYNNDIITYDDIKSSFIILFFYVLTLLNTEVLRALNYIYLSEFFRNTLKFVPVILGSFLLLYWGNPYDLVSFYLYGFIVLAILTSLIIYLNFRKIEFNSEQITSDKDISLGNIFKVSYPMAVSGLCFFLMLFFDIMLLKKYYSNEVVAYYSIGVKMFTILSMVIVAVNVNVAPKLAEFYSSKNIDELKFLIERSRKMIYMINIPVGFIIIFFGKTILGFFGENYVQAYLPMIILVLAQMIASFFGPVAIVLNMSNGQHVFKNILLVATAINLLCNVILTPKYGMIGGAISLFISLLFWNVYAAIYFKRMLFNEAKMNIQ